MTPPAVFAVHIADGILSWPCQACGFVVLAAGITVGMLRLSDRDIPRIGVLTAAFFVASQLHIPFGPISVHLLLNGLVGVILRYRSPLAIAVGLVLQALLFGHGGWLSLGVNFQVLAVPAFAAGWAFPRFASRLSPFAAGLVIGLFTAAVTVLLHVTVLWLGGSSDFRAVAGVSLVAHLPVIVIEGLVVGSACRVLAKAKPEWLCTPPRADEVREA
jgi:cobalt/nickel transport system permease protein